MRNLIRLAMEVAKDLSAVNEILKLNQGLLANPLSGEWMEGTQLKSALHLSKRTLQSLRDDGTLSFTCLNGKIYYKIEDIRDMLESNYKKKKQKSSNIKNRSTSC